MTEIISCLSLGGPYITLIPMQPRPRAETSKLLIPSLRFCIVSPCSKFQGRAERCEGDILILPSYCLFLLKVEKELGIRRAERLFWGWEELNSYHARPHKRAVFIARPNTRITVRTGA